MLSRKTSRKTSAGMTLVELMIAVAIVAILAAIAYPSYQAQVRRGNRTDAKTELMEVAQELEKCYTRYGAYNNGACTAFNLVTANNRLSERGKYRVQFVAVVDPINQFLLQASLVAGQPPDPDCGMLTLDQSGLRGRSGTDTIARCW